MIKSREHAARQVELFACQKMRADRLKDAAKAKVAKVLKEAAEESAPILRQCSDLEAELKAWFKVEEKSLGGARSIKFPYGTIGMHSKPEVQRLRGWSWDRCLDALLSAGRTELVRTSTAHEVDRTAILGDAQWHGEPLAEFGMKVGRSETFRIDLDPGDAKERLG
jgi:phage host-nuclease inhibitor protein Gam